MTKITYPDKSTLEIDRINDHYGITQLPYGPMIINTHDPAMVLLQDNVGEIKELSQFVQGVVIDVGANIGSHSINFAKQAHEIHAFEPHPNTFNNLCANLLLHMSRNVKPYQIALGSYNGDGMLDDFDLTQSHYSMGAFVGQIDDHAIRVPMRTLDSYHFSPVHFIKIDVEGGEYEVLKGANLTLQQENPIVYVEIHKTDLIEPIIEFMKDRGYNNMEFISYFMRDKETREDIPLTRGEIFWKEGRIVWVPQEQPS